MPLTKKIKQKYTYQDYLTWNDDERWEIIEGEAYNMSPAPKINHQEIVGSFYTYLKNKLSGKNCRPFISPIDVVFSDDNVVQPDVIVVCDSKKITEKNISGAPDLIIEVLSPSTSLKDKREKKILYEKFGVKEYLIIEPTDKFIERYWLSKGQFEGPEIFGPKEKIKLLSLKNLILPLKQIFTN